MQLVDHVEPLRFSLSAPVLPTLDILARGDSAGSGRHPVQDRAIQRRVDDLFVGHGGLPLSFDTLSRR